jgi:hypothetical protein
MDKKKLIQGVDFYYNELGFMVFTEKYLLDRGTCCKSRCKHCPYGYTEHAKKQAVSIKK